MNSLLNTNRYVIRKYELDNHDGEPCFFSCGRLKGIYLSKEQAEKACEIKQKDSEFFLEVQLYLGD